MCEAWGLDVLLFWSPEQCPNFDTAGIQEAAVCDVVSLLAPAAPRSCPWPRVCQIPKCMEKHKRVGGRLLKRGFYLLLWSSVLTPDSSPGHDNSAKLLFPSEPRPPGTKNTLETLTLSLFFSFFFRYKMIQTTIQNICAVDDYKKVGTPVSPHDAQLQCEHVILWYLSQNNHGHAGCYTFVHFQK